ncbi:hypothetical protein [Paenibacillus odorifer]|uniref:hypothetical protein n=1 Tax=Paenibacillus odorifer TaxID=189426 RepID=UPI0004F7648A|nr:hypothetical protein [Paenibacillus odorifer]AIQ72476.1 hypothetical protein PODO_03870 [Paenibacillus odorifer]MEC0129541.1 hypothetical protein [Paenibacillus odorifer]
MFVCFCFGIRADSSGENGLIVEKRDRSPESFPKESSLRKHMLCPDFTVEVKNSKKSGHNSDWNNSPFSERPPA